MKICTYKCNLKASYFPLHFNTSFFEISEIMKHVVLLLIIFFLVKVKNFLHHIYVVISR